MRFNFLLKPGSENRINSYAESMGHVLEFIRSSMGLRFSAIGLSSPRLTMRVSIHIRSGNSFPRIEMFDSSRPVPEERLQREVAYQWWGQTVGLKSFDDSWISQGFAEWSAFAFRESTLTGGALDSVQREQQERALTFEQTASIARAPSALDDQSAAYQSIVFHKGAMVFRMLRETIGKEKFDKLMHKFFRPIAARTRRSTTLKS